MKTRPVGELVRERELALHKLKPGSRTYLKVKKQLDGLVRFAVEQAKREEA